MQHHVLWASNSRRQGKVPLKKTWVLKRILVFRFIRGEWQVNLDKYFKLKLVPLSLIHISEPTRPY